MVFLHTSWGFPPKTFFCTISAIILLKDAVSYG